MSSPYAQDSIHDAVVFLAACGPCQDRPSVHAQDTHAIFMSWQNEAACLRGKIPYASSAVPTAREKKRWIIRICIRMPCEREDATRMSIELDTTCKVVVCRGAAIHTHGRIHAARDKSRCMMTKHRSELRMKGQKRRDPMGMIKDGLPHVSCVGPAVDSGVHGPRNDHIIDFANRSDLRANDQTT